VVFFIVFTCALLSVILVNYGSVSVPFEILISLLVLSKSVIFS